MQIILVSSGFDASAFDPLSAMMLSSADFRYGRWGQGPIYVILAPYTPPMRRGLSLIFRRFVESYDNGFLATHIHGFDLS